MDGAQALMKTLADAGAIVRFSNPGTAEMYFGRRWTKSRACWQLRASSSRRAPSCSRRSARPESNVAWDSRTSSA